MWDPYAEFQSETLPNGLTIYAAYWPERPWEAMGFLIHSGAEHDPIGREGLAHFVEHLVSENANVSKKELIAFFEDCGGMVSLGTTSYPYTYYRFFVPTNKAIVERAFWIFGYMLLSAKLEKFIERERQIIIAEFQRKYPTKFQLDLAVRERKALYAGYWLERFVCPLGNPESVGRITQDELQSYYDTHYTPANMSIIGVGGMKLEELIELLYESPFATIKNGVRTPLPTPITDVAPPLETRYIFEASPIIPIEVGVYRSVAKIPGNINEQIIRITRGMLNEVLNEELREQRAWVYAIESSYKNFRYFYEFSINCVEIPLNAIGEIEKVIEICIASLEDREDLFEQVKRRALANNFMIDQTARGICNNAINYLANYQRIISLAEIRNNLEQVTMNEVRDLLQWLRPERRWTLIIQP
jgi:predicted Zn-dependent peptidase